MCSDLGEYCVKSDLKSKKNVSLINNTYKEIYIRLMIDTLKEQVTNISERGCSVYLLNAMIKGIEKFFSHTLDNLHDLEKTAKNLEILKRTVNAMRNLCLEIERTNAVCNIRIINKLFLKNLHIFFPRGVQTRQLFRNGSNSNGSDQGYDFFNRLLKISVIRSLGKIIKKMFSDEALEKHL